MSMYKNIFVNEDESSASVSIMGINGEIQMFGEGAFASVEQAVEAVKSVHSNAVIKVASGKYDSYFVVVNEGESLTPSKVVSLDFDGGVMATADGDVTVAGSGLSVEAQLSIIDDLNAANAANGTVYVLNDAEADTTLYVGMGEANYVVGQNAAAVYAENAADIFDIINNAANVSTLTTAYDENLAISVDTTFDGEVSNSQVTKVVNGATLTIGKDAKYTGGFLAAGNDTYFGFGEDFAAKGGTIDIAGNVKVNQTNADGGGVVNVKTGAVLNSGEICIENGGIADAKAGVLNVDGTVNVGSLRVFNGGEVNVAGTVVADQTDNPNGGYIVTDLWGEGSKLNINGGTFNVKDDMRVQAGAELNVNSGKLNVDYSLTNGGTFNISGDSEVRINTFTGAAQIQGSATLTDSDLAAGTVYVGYKGYSDEQVDLTVKGDTFSSKGIMYVGTDDAKHTLTIEAADAYVGNIYIRAKGEVNISGNEVELSYISQKGAVNIDGAEVTIREWLIGNSKSADVASVTVTDSVITQINNGGITVGYEAAATFSMTDSTLNMTYSGLTISEGSTFTMIDSALSTTNINNAGALNITVSADFLSDLTGKFTLVNQSNADAAALDSLEINVAGNKYSVGDSWKANGIVYSISNGSGNDIVLSADHEKIFVDASYTADTVGYGVNKFSDFESALAAAAANKAVNRIEILSDISQSVANAGEVYNITQHLTIGVADGKKFTVDLSRENGGTLSIYQMNASSSVEIEDGVILKGVDIVANGFATSDNKLTINGEVYALSLKQWTSNNEILVGETGKVVLGYGDGQFDMAYGNGSVTINGVLSEDADLTKLTVADAQFKAGYSGTRGSSNTLNLNNTYFEGGAWFNLNGSNGTINMDNSLLTVSGGDSSGSLNINSSGNTVNVANGSLLNVGKVVVGAGNTINVEDSSLKVSTLTNSGTVAVSGESTLNIGSLTGSSSIDLLDGAIIKDSTVGGTATVLGNVIFRGDNTFSMITDFGAAYSETSAFWTVEAGSSLTITSGDRYGLGYGDKAAVYGELEDARKIDRTTLTVEDASLNFYGGLVGMSNWDTKQEFTVQDAYVRFGIEKDKSFGNKAGNYYGTYEYNVDNSVLEAKGFKFYEAQSQSTFNAADSQIYVHGVFMTNDADSVFNFTNTTITSNATSNGTDDKNQNAGEMNFVKSDITYSAAFTNIGKITTDAASSITATAVVSTGSINSNLENTAKIIGDFTVAGNFATGDLIIGKNGALSAGSITVSNLTLEIGGELTLTGSGSSVAAEYITVTGSIASAEYQLVMNGWSGDLLNKTVKFDADGNGKIDSDELFTVQSEIANLSGVNFVAQDGKLYVKDFGAAKTSIYICEDLANAADGTTVEVDGVTYTVGKDAFASVENALASSDVKAENITEITVGNGDHINDIAEKFVNVDKIIVPADKEIIDTDASEFQGDLVIDNDGHLEADITAKGKVTLTNTSGNTFVGELTGADVDVVNTTTGKVEDAVLSADKLGGGTLTLDNQGVIEDTVLSAVDGMVNVKGDGTFTNVDVKSDALYLNGLDFTLDAGSDVESVYMGSKDAGSLTIDGAVVDQVFGGALDASGEVTFGAGSNLSNTTIEDVDKVILSAGSHAFGAADANREYYMNGLELGSADLTWNWSDAEEFAYNIGTPVNQDEGMVKVTNTADDATLNFTQNGEYSLGDFDVSGFDGIVNVDDASDSVKSTLTLKENTDYFADGATINISADGTLNLDGAGNKGNSDFDVDFNGAGTINVNADHYLGAEGTINDFTGTINLGSNRIDLEAKNTTAAKFTGDSDAKLYAWGADQEYTLDGAFDEFAGMIGTVDGATVTISGENTTDAVLGHRWDYNTGHYIFTADQTFNSDGALDGVLGANNSSITVDSAADLTLKGENSVSAVLKGAGDVIADADQSFTGDVSGFTGTYTANSDATTGDYVVTFTKDSTLAAEMTLNGEGKFVLESQGAQVTVNSDANATDLSISNNCVTLDSGVYGMVDGVDNSKLIINSLISADEVAVDALVINAGKSLTADKVTAESTYVYILNPGEQGPAITVTDNSSSFGDISVNSWSSAFTTPFTIVDSVTGQVYTDTVVFILGVGAGTGLTVDGLAQEIDGKFVRVYTQDGDLLIGNYNGTSNAVYVNSDWSTVSGTVEKWTVSNTGTPNDTDRIIDRDASKTLENAVKIIRAEADGKGQIFVVKGDTYSTPAALMTADNKVTDLVIEGKGFEEFNNTQDAVKVGDAVIEGGIVGMESAASGSLTLKNVSVSGNIYAGAVVNGTAGSDTDSTGLTLDGGYFMSSNIAGGSFVQSGAYTVKSSEVVIQNTTGEEMVILGRVLGGSIAKDGATVTQESASVSIDASDALTIRGDIYAAGSGAGVSVENTKVTFSGDAANLTFTGRVSGGAHGQAVGAFAGESELVFNNFSGVFKGLVQDFDVITISGDSALEFSRKQTLTAETDLVFNLAGRTSTDAMFTVNSFGWSYGDTVSVEEINFFSGKHILIDGADVDFSALNYTIGGNAYTLGDTYTEADGDTYILNVEAGKLVLDYNKANGVAEVTGNSNEQQSVSGFGKVDVATGAELDTGSNVAINLNGETGRDAAFIVNIAENSSVKTEANNVGIFLSGSDLGENVSVDLVNDGTVTSGSLLRADFSTASGENEFDLNFTNKGTISVSGTGVHSSVFTTGNSNSNVYLNNEGTITAHNSDGDMWGVDAGISLYGTNSGTIESDSVALGSSFGEMDITNTGTLKVNAGKTAIAAGMYTTSNDVINNQGVIIGNVKTYKGDDTLNLFVDSVLNGSTDLGAGNDIINVTGFNGLDKAGAVAVAGSISNVETFQLDGVDSILGGAVQVAGKATVADTTDDVWASLNQVNGDLVVAWGKTEAEMGAALDAFDDAARTLGTAVIADGSSFTEMDHDTFSDKKNNGTLA